MEAVRPSPFLSRISYKVLTYLESYFLDEGVAHSAIAKDAATAREREYRVSGRFSGMQCDILRQVHNKFKCLYMCDAES